MNKQKVELIEKLEDAVNKCLENAFKIFNIRVSYPTINVTLKSIRMAGRAIIIRNEDTIKNTLRFNYKLYAAAPDLFINEVVPHEVAHIINYNMYERTIAHDFKWKYICLKLGGSGSTYLIKELHEILASISPGYKYKCACTIHNLSTRMHNKIEKGASYNCKDCRKKLERIK